MTDGIEAWREDAPPSRRVHAVLRADPVRSYCNQELIAEAEMKGEGRHTAETVAEEAGLSVPGATKWLEGHVDTGVVSRDKREGKVMYYVSETDRLRQLSDLVSHHDREELREEHATVKARLEEIREKSGDDAMEMESFGGDTGRRELKLRQGLLDDAVMNYPYYVRRMEF